MVTPAPLETPATAQAPVRVAPVLIVVLAARA